MHSNIKVILSMHFLQCSKPLNDMHIKLSGYIQSQNYNTIKIKICLQLKLDIFRHYSTYMVKQKCSPLRGAVLLFRQKYPKTPGRRYSKETVTAYLVIFVTLLFATLCSNPLNRHAQQGEIDACRFTPKYTAVSQTVSNCHIYDRP